MIPKLFIPGTTDFSNEGLGRLTDCTSFVVTEERNGIYEAEFGYPIEGRLFPELREGYIVYGTHDDSKKPQPFEIYYHQAPIEGIVTYRARHVSYQLNNVICRPFSASDCAGALAGIPGAAITGCAFSFSTDKAVTAPFKTTVPQSARSILGGTQGSILDVYGKGDYEFDGFNVKLWVNRGSDRGVSIRYGKNLVSLDQQFDGSNQYNAFVPYWQDTDGNAVYLDHAVMGNTQNTTIGPLQVRSFEAIQTHVPEDILVRYGSIKTVALDMSSYFEARPSLAELEARAQELINNSDAYEVKENLNIDFVQLWQTEEYKSVANLQRILLCDTVHIYYEKLGINATAKCIKVVYDTLNERYLSMELGQPTTTLSEQVVSLVGTETKAQIQEAKSTIAEAIKNATELITGGFGGYIKYNYLPDGTPSEMLIMDSPEEISATNIIRLNQNGLGFSTDGGATYGNAWTIDGKLNADYIVTGTLDASVVNVTNINASNITTGTLNVGNIAIAGTLSDTDGKNSWNFTTGNLIATQGKIGGFTINSEGLVQGSTTDDSGGISLVPAQLELSDGEYKVAMNRGFIEYSTYIASPLSVDSGTIPIGWLENGTIWSDFKYVSEDAIARGGFEFTVFGQTIMNLYAYYSADSSSPTDLPYVQLFGELSADDIDCWDLTVNNDLNVSGSGGNVLLIH